MTVRELTDVYFLGDYDIFYFDGPMGCASTTIDRKDYLSDRVLDLKVRAFSPCEFNQGIRIMVEKPSWV